MAKTKQILDARVSDPDHIEPAKAPEFSVVGFGAALNLEIQEARKDPETGAWIIGVLSRDREFVVQIPPEITAMLWERVAGQQEETQPEEVRRPYRERMRPIGGAGKFGLDEDADAEDFDEVPPGAIAAV